MNIYVQYISRTRTTARPQIRFFGEWLAEIGFTPGVLIQLLPEPNGVVFQLYNEIVQKYSDFLKETQAKGGKIIHGCYEYEHGLHLITSGECIRAGGLEFGDFCIARYDYGIIRVRKLPPRTKVIIPKLKNPKSRMLCGNWLTEIGFVPDAIMTVSAEPGKITLSLRNNGIENYAGLVKYARANNMRVVQVMKKTKLICIAIPDLCLNKAGFTMEDPFYTQYDHGVITLSKLNFEALGF